MTVLKHKKPKHFYVDELDSRDSTVKYPHESAYKAGENLQMPTRSSVYLR